MPDLIRLGSALRATDPRPAGGTELLRRLQLGGFRMPLDLVADGGADEVGAIGVEPFLHQKIDMAQIDVAEVDCDLLGVGGFASELKHVVGHLTIPSPSAWMVNGGSSPD